MSEIHYLTGDATDPVGDGVKILAHVCNDVGGWGAGFVMALSAKDRRPEDFYRQMAAESDSGWLTLGDIQITLFDPTGQGADDTDIFVANMIAQRGFKTVLNNIPLDYKALETCLDEVGKEAADMGATVHMPRIGCGLAGGEWSRVEEIISETLINTHGVEVYVYDLPTAA